MPVKLSEVEASLGRYTAEDRVFLFSQNGVTNAPEVGSTITEGTDWTILSVRKDRQTNRFRVVCRSSAVIGTVTIQTATFSQDDHGIQTATWTDSLTDVPATITKDSAAVETEHQVDKMKTRYSVHFLTAQTITKNTRIKDGALILRPIGLQDLESLTDLFTVKAEEW